MTLRKTKSSFIHSASTLILDLTLFKEHIILYIYWGSASPGIDDWQSSDIEKNDWLGQPRPSSSFQVELKILKEMGPNQALTDSTIESLKDPCNHHCGIDYVKWSINVAIESFPQKGWLPILQPRFEESRERELQASLFKKNLLEHKCFECWMCLFVECVTDQDKHAQSRGQFKNIKSTTLRLKMLTCFWQKIPWCDLCYQVMTAVF